MALEVHPLNVDPAFLPPKEHRPAHAHDFYLHTTDRIPVIDLAPLLQQQQLNDPRSLQALADEIGAACQEWGFFQVVNHGIAPGLISRLKEEAQAFFALPLEDKRKVKRSFKAFLGYNDTELTKNVRDWKEVFDFVIGRAIELPVNCEGDSTETYTIENQWPSDRPGFREACEQYSAAVEKLAFSLLELISRSLGLTPKRFQDYFKRSDDVGTTSMRLNHYPVCPAPELALGVNRHKDGGGLTVLLQDDVGGLEVKRKDGEWIGVKPDPSGFVINVGDMIQVWSNDKYQSVEHRVVVNERRDRYSYPVFFNPVHSVDVSPIPELTDEQHPSRYKTFNWGKYRKRKNDTNFKNFGVENTQISHYAIHV